MKKRDPFDPTALDRFVELRAFARSLGACWSCSTWLAMKQIDREFAFTTAPEPAVCAHGDDRCVKAARAAWKTMPARPAESKAA